jgi:hypothetical protein
MAGKKFLGVTFKCCNVYTRVYINKDGDAFEGICPRCYKKKVVVRIVAKGGTKARFFDAE